jgi:hypothetical protein
VEVTINNDFFNERDLTKICVLIETQQPTKRTRKIDQHYATLVTQKKGSDVKLGVEEIKRSHICCLLSVWNLMASEAKKLIQQKMEEANKGPGYVDNGPNFKPGWKSTGFSGGGVSGHEGKYKKAKRVEFDKPPPPKVCCVLLSKTTSPS